MYCHVAIVMIYYYIFNYYVIVIILVTVGGGEPVNHDLFGEDEVHSKPAFSKQASHADWHQLTPLIPSSN